MVTIKLFNKKVWFLVILLFPPQVFPQECVILLHGMARSNSSMDKLSNALDKSGYLTVNYDYPSTKYPVNKLAYQAITDALAQCQQTSKINFVTHSLGGILVRHYLSNNSIDNMGRVVMLGPPNKGSQVVDELRSMPGFELINGPAGLQLGTENDSVPNTLGPADFEVGIIAGTSTINFFLSTMLPNPNDGKVSVESTKLEGMADHISMPVTHPFMMNNEQVIKQVIYFLNNGVFKLIKDNSIAD